MPSLSTFSCTNTVYDGNPITKMSWPQFILQLFTEHDEKQKRVDDLFEITFEVSEEALGLPTFALLPIMLFQMATKEKRPKSWYEVVKNDKYGSTTYSQFKKAIDEGLDIFVKYVFKMVPHKYPDFLPPKQSNESL